MLKRIFSSVSKSEIAKFEAVAKEWWDPTGPFAPLHSLNPVRMGVIRTWVGNPRGRECADVGCGGGIASESLSRMGMTVTAIDPGERNIEIATWHKSLDPTLTNLQYVANTAESIDRQFDVVCCLEVIEHVDNQKDFIKTLGRLTKPGGLLVVSSINKTKFAYLSAIFAAEKVLRWVPEGTHEFEKFISPQSIAEIICEDGDFHDDHEIVGFKPWVNKTWSVVPETGVNYMAAFRKKLPNEE